MSAANLALSLQTASIGSTLLLTPTADTVYRLNYYISPRPGSPCRITALLTFTDLGSAQTIYLASASLSNSTNGYAGSVTFRAKAGHDILVSVNAMGSQVIYDADFILEELS